MNSDEILEVGDSVMVRLPQLPHGAYYSLEVSVMESCVREVEKISNGRYKITTSRFWFPREWLVLMQKYNAFQPGDIVSVNCPCGEWHGRKGLAIRYNSGNWTVLLDGDTKPVEIVQHLLELVSSEGRAKPPHYEEVQKMAIAIEDLKRRFDAFESRFNHE